eukprot:SAG31_NODE_2687_length_5245_cov_1.854676_2_plen_117_part_00
MAVSPFDEHFEEKEKRTLPGCCLLMVLKWLAWCPKPVALQLSKSLVESTMDWFGVLFMRLQKVQAAFCQWDRDDRHGGQDQMSLSVQWAFQPNRRSQKSTGFLSSKDECLPLSLCS